VAPFSRISAWRSGTTYRVLGTLVALGALFAFTTALAAAQSASVPLTVTKSASPNPVNVGANLTYTITVANSNPGGVASPTTVLTDVLPAGANFVSASPSQGTCSIASGTVTCQLGTLNSGAAAATITIVVTPTSAGTLSNTASATGSPRGDGTFEFAGTSNTVTTTVQTPGGNACPATPGFWKNHSTSAPGNQANLWPVGSLTLGSHTYTEAQILTLFANFKPSGSGDASMILAYQLFAAKLNVLSGTANAGSIAGAITSADALLTSAGSGSLPYNIAPSSSLGQQMTTVAGQLDAYNNSNPSGCTPLA
jgi:uncharacterized repeat protein (TIGR01451 family)